MKKNEYNPFFGKINESYEEISESYEENEPNGNLKEEKESSKEDINGNTLKVNYLNNQNDKIYTEYYDSNSVNFKKCECGSDSANLMRHSNWCPKFESWMEK